MHKISKVCFLCRESKSKNNCFAILVIKQYTFVVLGKYKLLIEERRFSRLNMTKLLACLGNLDFSSR